MCAGTGDLDMILMGMDTGTLGVARLCTGHLVCVYAEVRLYPASLLAEVAARAGGEAAVVAHQARPPVLLHAVSPDMRVTNAPALSQESYAFVCGRSDGCCAAFTRLVWWRLWQCVRA